MLANWIKISQKGKKKGWKKIFYAKSNQREQGYKYQTKNFKSKMFSGNKEHTVLIKVSIQQRDNINVCAPNDRP